MGEFIHVCLKMKLISFVKSEKKKKKKTVKNLYSEKRTDCFFLFSLFDFVKMSGHFFFFFVCSFPLM